MRRASVSKGCQNMWRPTRVICLPNRKGFCSPAWRTQISKLKNSSRNATSSKHGMYAYVSSTGYPTSTSSVVSPGPRQGLDLFPGLDLPPFPCVGGERTSCDSTRKGLKCWRMKLLDVDVIEGAVQEHQQRRGPKEFRLPVLTRDLYQSNLRDPRRDSCAPLLGLQVGLVHAFFLSAVHYTSPCLVATNVLSYGRTKTPYVIKQV